MTTRRGLSQLLPAAPVVWSCLGVADGAFGAAQVCRAVDVEAQKSVHRLRFSRISPLHFSRSIERLCMAAVVRQSKSSEDHCHHVRPTARAPGATDGFPRAWVSDDRSNLSFSRSRACIKSHRPESVSSAATKSQSNRTHLLLFALALSKALRVLLALLLSLTPRESRLRLLLQRGSDPALLLRAVLLTLRPSPQQSSRGWFSAGLFRRRKSVLRWPYDCRPRKGGVVSPSSSREW